MSYKTRQDVISAAQARGSKSTQYKSAVKYLITHPESDNNNGYTPLQCNRDRCAVKTYISKRLIAWDVLRGIAQGCEASAKKSARSYIRSKHADWVTHVKSSPGVVRYGGSRGCYPLHYTNPGVVARPLAGGDVAVDVYDYTGVVRNTVVIPGRHVPRLTINGQLSRDVYAIHRHRGVVQRFDAAGKSVGYAVQTDYGWEHGATMAEIKREIAHKRQIAEAKKLQAQKTARQLRATRLIVRLCRNMALNFEDARAVGYCVAGINDWRAKNNINGDTVRACDIPATADNRWLSVAEYRAAKIAEEIINAKY